MRDVTSHKREQPRRIIDLFTSEFNSRLILLLVTFVGCGVVGLSLLISARAAAPSAAAEPEDGVVSSAAGAVSDSSASGAQAVEFGSGSSSNPDPVGQPAGEWSLKFDDEFSASSVTTVDAGNGLVKFGSGPTWKAWYPNDDVGDGNQHSNNPGTELEYYDISGLSVGGGNLTLTATHDNIHSGLPYTSGMIQSNPSFNAQYGYAEARIKAPAVSGSWPAFWIISSTYEWPPEVDIFENFGGGSSYSVSNFGSGATVFADQVNTTINTWHVYGLKWAADTMVWYLDGNVVATETNASSIPAKQMYMVIDLAVRNTDTASFSAQVDYVRYWQQDN